jgi:ribonuclease VapC
VNEPPHFVLDASALLAVVRHERGSDVVETRLDRSEISAVNWSEVVERGRYRGVNMDGARAEFEVTGLRFVPFSLDDAEATALLYPSTAPLGLGFADRACLALAQRQRATALTAERRWRDLDIGIRIEVIR